jgi:hypothetical protein
LVPFGELAFLLHRVHPPLIPFVVELFVFAFLDDLLQWLDRVLGVHGWFDDPQINGVHFFQKLCAKLFVDILEVRYSLFRLGFCPSVDGIAVVFGCSAADDGLIHEVELGDHLELGT